MGKCAPITMRFKNIPSEQAVKVVPDRGGREVVAEHTLPRNPPIPAPSHSLSERANARIHL